MPAINMEDFPTRPTIIIEDPTTNFWLGNSSESPRAIRYEGKMCTFQLLKKREHILLRSVVLIFRLTLSS